MKKYVWASLSIAVLFTACRLDLQALLELISSDDLTNPVMGSLTVNRSQTAIVAIDSVAPARRLKSFDMNGDLIASAKFPPAVAVAADWIKPSWFWTLDSSGRLIRWNPSLTKPELLHRVPAGPANMTRTYCDFDVTKDGVFYITTLERFVIGHGAEQVQGQVLRFDPANNAAPLISTWDAGTAGANHPNVPAGHPLFFVDRCPRVSVDPVKNTAYVLDHNDDINDMTRVVSYSDQLAVTDQYNLPLVIDALDLAVVATEAAVTYHTPGHLPMIELYSLTAQNGPALDSSTPMWSEAGVFFSGSFLNENPPGFNIWLDSPMNGEDFAVTKIPVQE